MKYMISWFERPQGSPAEYENAQKRILEVFTQWKAPDEFQDRVVRGASGRLGRVYVLDCDDPLAVHKFCSTFPAFVFEARPVVPVDGRCPGRTRSHRLARRAETQLTSEKITSDRPKCVRYGYQWRAETLASEDLANWI